MLGFVSASSIDERGVFCRTLTGLLEILQRKPMELEDVAKDDAYDLRSTIVPFGRQGLNVSEARETFAQLLILRQ